MCNSRSTRDRYIDSTIRSVPSSDRRRHIDRPNRPTNGSGQGIQASTLAAQATLASTKLFAFSLPLSLLFPSFSCLAPLPIVPLLLIGLVALLAHRACAGGWARQIFGTKGLLLDLHCTRMRPDHLFIKCCPSWVALEKSDCCHCLYLS